MAAPAMTHHPILSCFGDMAVSKRKGRHTGALGYTFALDFITVEMSFR